MGKEFNAICKNVGGKCFFLKQLNFKPKHA